mmetsp:Transcript_36145/g.83296  ORF Transcript_36145/g.83296 Transcript_36145/m.83296 type:complete len:494 (-) Transcript_36145:94-1575(-)
MASGEDALLSFGCCCRCIDEDGGHQVAKLPDWSWKANDTGEDDEEEISFGPLVKVRAIQGQSVEEWSSMGRLKPRDLDFSELSRFGQGIKISKVDRRGITFDQLKKVLVFVKKRCDENGVIRGWYDSRTGEPLHYRSLTLAQLHHWVIQPVTMRQQCSYVEAVAKEEYGQLPAWFIGHTWQEPLVDFVRRAMKCGTLGAGDAFWSFAFSTRWGDCQEMLAHGSPSVECLRTLTSLKVVLAGCASTASVEDMQESLPCLHQLTSLRVQTTRSPKLVEARPLGSAGLSALRALASLRLDFTSCSTLQSVDSLCRSLAGLGHQLLVLELSFSNCMELQQLGGGSSSAECPGGCCLPGLHVLRELTVDASGCRSLSAVDVLSEEMKALSSVHLRFPDCSMLTSLEALSRPLAALTSVSTFELCVAGCVALRKLGDLDVHLRSMPALAKLRLNLSSCEALAPEVGLQLQTCWEELPSDVDVFILGCPSHSQSSKILPL